MHTAEPCMRHWENSQRSSKPMKAWGKRRVIRFSIHVQWSRGIFQFYSRTLAPTSDVKSHIIQFENITVFSMRFLVIFTLLDTIWISSLFQNWQHKSHPFFIHIYLFESNKTSKVSRINKNYVKSRWDRTSTTSEKRYNKLQA